MDFEKIEFDKKYLEKHNDNDINSFSNILRDSFDKLNANIDRNGRIKIIHEIFILLSVNKWYISKVDEKFGKAVVKKLNEFKQTEDMADIMKYYEECMFGNKNILTDYNKFKKSSATFNFNLTDGKDVKDVII